MKRYVHPNIKIIDVDFGNVLISASNNTTFDIPGMEWEEAPTYRTNLWNTETDEE